MHIDNSNIRTQDEFPIKTTRIITTADVQKQFDSPNESIKVNSQRLEKEPEKFHDSEDINKKSSVIQNRIDVNEESPVKISKLYRNC